MLSKCQLILKFIFLQLSFDILFILFLRSYTSCPYYIYSAGTTCTYSSIQDIFHILSNCFFPFKYPMKLDIDTFVKISTRICTLSEQIPACNIFTFSQAHIVLKIFPTSHLFSLYNNIFLFFGTNAIWPKLYYI